MNRLDRALGILLMLRSGATVAAAELARRFEVSPRTIYRDIETLSAVGVPVYAEMGRSGGFRLAEGYFLPPIMFSEREAVALLVGGALLRRLRATPFAAELDTATRKVLASLPEQMRAALLRASQAIGFEPVPPDLLHPEPAEPATLEHARLNEGAVLSTFVEAMLRRAAVVLDYRSPYQAEHLVHTLAPCGLVWDRDRWYLVGVRLGTTEPRMWRSDRAVGARLGAALDADSAFDLRQVLGRQWLRAAFAGWAVEAPVVLHLTHAQAERLRQDWYYGHAEYAELPDGKVRMGFGEDNPAVVLALLRWLGRGAVLIEPRAWRPLLRAELQTMLGEHADGSTN
jgi:predicted DNA-binding transcriptional regulator YafY